MDVGDEPARGDALSPADALRARAEATDRAARFEQRLDVVEQVRTRRRWLRRLGRVAGVVVGAAVGAVVPVVVAAVVRGPDPTGADALLAAAIGAVVGAVGPVLRDRLAARRGAEAWDAYRERYVLLGNPSAVVRDADRPEQQRGGPPPPAHR